MRVYKSQSLKEDPRLHNRLTEILSTSWTNPKKTLDDELVRASHLACIFEKERVMAFISWRCQNTATEQGTLTTGYVGIGAVSEEAKGRGLGKKIFSAGLLHCFNDATLLLTRDAHPLSPLIWGTTASSVSYLGIRNTFEMLPDENEALLNAEALHALQSLYKQQGFGIVDDKNPFVLRRKMSIRYTESEHLRLQKVLKENPCALIESIDERQGDRLLMILSKGPKGPRLRSGDLLASLA